MDVVWNLGRCSSICMEQLGYLCAQLERLEGRDIACEQCRVVQEIIDEGIPRFDKDADEDRIKYLAFVVRVNSAGSNMRNPTLDRRD